MREPTSLRGLLWANRGAVVLLAVLSIAGATGTTLFVARLSQSAASSKSDDLTVILAMLGLVIGGRIAVEILSMRIATRFAENVRTALVHSILKLPLETIERVGPGVINTALIQDVASVCLALMSAANVVANSANALILLGYVGVLSWKLLLWTLLFVIPGALLAVPGKFQNMLRTKERLLYDDVAEGAMALTMGAKEVRLNTARAQDLLNKQLIPAIKASVAATRRSNIPHAFSSGIAGATIYIATGLVLAKRGWLGLEHSDAIAAYVVAGFALAGPLESLTMLAAPIASGRVAIANLRRLGLAFESKDLSRGDKPVARNWSELNLSEVTHVYRNDDAAENFEVGPIDASFEPGQITFIVGGNGSGKTTLVKLITGLYSCSSGEIWFNGEQITDKNVAWYRDHFSSVFQDFYVANTLHGIELNDELLARAQGYLERLGLASKVSLRNGKFSTTALSHGQRKRLALVVAYLEDRPIYVFDEWAADQDPNFRRVFYMELLPELRERGKCVIAITHDDRYFHLADQTIKMEGGKLASELTSEFTSRLLTGLKRP